MLQPLSMFIHNTYEKRWSRWRKLYPTTLGVVWNLVGHEGNISRVAAGLPVNKAARITKAKSSDDHHNKDSKIFQSLKRWRNLIIIPLFCSYGVSKSCWGGQVSKFVASRHSSPLPQNHYSIGNGNSPTLPSVDIFKPPPSPSLSLCF